MEVELAVPIPAANDRADDVHDNCPQCTRDAQKGPHPIETCGFWSILWFMFVNDILRIGSKRPLTEEDIHNLPKGESVHVSTDAFLHAWQRAQQNGSTSVIGSIFQTFWRLSMKSGCSQLLGNIFLLAIPFVIRDLVQFLSVRRTNAARGLIDAALIFAFNMLVSLFMNNQFFLATRCSGCIRQALMAAIYRKSLNLNPAARMACNTGETVNLMSSDAQRAYEGIIYIHWIWIAPLMVAFASIFLILELGISAVLGLVATLLQIPLQVQFVKLSQNYRVQMLKFTDKRITFTSEMLTGIRIIKQYAWENHVSRRVQSLRDAEVCQLWRLGYFTHLGTAIVNIWPLLVSTVIFSAYGLLGNKITSDKVFFVLSMLVSIRFPISLLQKSVATGIDSLVSLRRISRFMCLPELHSTVDWKGAIGHIKVQSCDFKWDAARDIILRNVNLAVEPGQLVMVVGMVAAGKSSLLAGILGEMHVVGRSGNPVLEMNGSVSYTSQTSWIRNCSLRDNILFGSPYDEAAYSEVIAASALQPDLDVFPAGDMTEIGEQGINLSGGQKARITFARALYKRSDISLFDDIFAAVDVGTGLKMFEKGIQALLKGKTRVLTLNSHLHVLKDADLIVVMSQQEGYCVVGEILDNYQDFEIRYPNMVNSESATTLSVEPTDSVTQDVSLPAIVSVSSAIDQIGTQVVPHNAGRVLIDQERSKVGSVLKQVYWTYFNAGSRQHAAAALFGILFLYTSGQVARVGGDYWAALWAQTNRSVDTQLSTSFWVYSLTGWTIAGFVFSIARTYLLNEICCLSSKTLHYNLLHSLLRAPITTFFDVTPIGRIVNRFSKDMDQADVLLPDFLDQLLMYSLTLACSVILACVAIPLFIIPFIPLSAFFYYVQSYFRRTSRQVKRIEGTTRSPIFSSFEETLSGLTSIRAFKMKTLFIRNTDHAIAANSRSLLASQFVARWLALRLDLIVVIVIGGLGAFIVAFRNSINPALGALALVYTLQLTGLLQWTVRVSVEVENNMTAVERILEYSNLTPERPNAILGKDPDAGTWPTKGSIDIKNLSVRYRPELPLVLHGITCSIKPREKIGICGRTGSGKSSVAQCLLRIIEPEAEGTVVIDSIDTSTIGLKILRQSISIIPQDAVLFSGTVRENLDPFNERDNDRIWSVLEQIHLKAAIESLPNRLDETVSERGSNFSHGQRQLICIARAFLRDSKIIICDEATSGIDSETDQLIQVAIRTLFRDRTVITIAHRLRTIADSDKIMVLSKGHILEFDSPFNLLSNPQSQFKELVSSSGKGAVRQFLEIARSHMESQ